MTIRNTFNLIAAVTLTAAADEIVADPGDGYQVVLLELMIKNTDSQMRSVTITDGTTTFGVYEIEAGESLSINFWPPETGWFAAASAALSATPSADSVLKVGSGKYLKQQVPA